MTEDRRRKRAGAPDDPLMAAGPFTLTWRETTVGVDRMGEFWMLEHSGRTERGPAVKRREPWSETAERIREWLDVKFGEEKPRP